MPTVFLNYDINDVDENNSYLDTNEDDGNESNIDPSKLLDQKNVLEEDGSEEEVGKTNILEPTIEINMAEDSDSEDDVPDLELFEPSVFIGLDSEEGGDEADEIADNKTGSSTDSVNNIVISQQPEEMLRIIDNEDLKHKSVVDL